MVTSGLCGLKRRVYPWRVAPQQSPFPFQLSDYKGTNEFHNTNRNNVKYVNILGVQHRNEYS